MHISSYTLTNHIYFGLPRRRLRLGQRRIRRVCSHSRHTMCQDVRGCLGIARQHSRRKGVVSDDSVAPRSGRELGRFSQMSPAGGRKSAKELRCALFLGEGGSSDLSVALPCCSAPDRCSRWVSASCCLTSCRCPFYVVRGDRSALGSFSSLVAELDPVTGFGSVGPGGPVVGFCRSGRRCLDGVGGCMASVVYRQVRPGCLLRPVAALDGDRLP